MQDITYNECADLEAVARALLKADPNGSEVSMYNLLEACCVACKKQQSRDAYKTAHSAGMRFALEFYDQAKKHEVLSEERADAMRLATNMYKLAAICSAFMLEEHATPEDYDLIIENPSFVPKHLESTPFFDFSMNDLQETYSTLEMKWIDVRYHKEKSGHIVSYLEALDATCGLIALGKSNAEHVTDYGPIQPLHNDLEAMYYRWFQECAVCALAMHRETAIAMAFFSRVTDRRAVPPGSGETCSEEGKSIERFILEKAESTKYRPDQARFINIYWNQRAEPSELERAQMECKKRNKVITVSSAIKRRRGKSWIQSTAQMLYADEPWEIYAKLSPSEAGIIFFLMVNGYLTGLTRKPWYASHVDMFPSGVTMMRANATPIIVRVFRQYHVFYCNVLYPCGHAVDAFRKWLSVHLHVDGIDERCLV